MCCDQHAFSKVWNLVMFSWDTSNFLDPMLLEKQVFLAMMMVICAQMPIMHVGFFVFLKLDFEFVDPWDLIRQLLCLYKCLIVITFIWSLSSVWRLFLAKKVIYYYSQFMFEPFYDFVFMSKLIVVIDYCPCQSLKWVVIIALLVPGYAKIYGS